MAANKKLRTPIIKPRTQGGTFYTFGSAMEDIGLNINSTQNIVELSHYVLLDIPSFNKNSMGTMYETSGDTVFAEAFQDYVLNMETCARNTSTYNYASNKTVSERIFWKWIFKNYSNEHFVSDNTYYYESENEIPIAKAFGRIYSGSQRSDSYGLYNETFVQIPSSYGKMRVLFKERKDENYNDSSIYPTNTNGIIENISTDEYDQYTYKLHSTGISAHGIFDSSIEEQGGFFKYLYNPKHGSNSNFLEAVLDIGELRDYYDNGELTYDDIAFGIDGSAGGDFTFNAILVYYSIYDSTGTNTLATNAYGVYILNKAIIDSSVADSSSFVFPSLLKEQSTQSKDGTSFSFRLNIKPSSAYSGDITLSDNSTGAFSMSEDFNDTIKNLNDAVNILMSNSKILYQINNDNEELKQLAISSMEKASEVEQYVNEIAAITPSLMQTCDELISITTIGTEIGAKYYDILNNKYTWLKNTKGELINISVNSPYVILYYDTMSNQGSGTFTKQSITNTYSLENGKYYLRNRTVA